MKLTNRSKLVSNKEMTLAERIYLPAIAKGMAITLKHAFQKPATIKYPEQTREYAPVYRGWHVLKRDDAGAERCTACGLCAVACPAEAITMVAAERKKGEENLYREEKYAAFTSAASKPQEIWIQSVPTNLKFPPRDTHAT